MRQHIYTFINIFICIYIYIYIHISRLALERTMAELDACDMYMYIFLYLYMYIYIYIYIYICTHMYVCVYVYTSHFSLLTFFPFSLALDDVAASRAQLTRATSDAICIYMYVYVYVYIYTYIYVCIYGRTFRYLYYFSLFPQPSTTMLRARPNSATRVRTQRDGEGRRSLRERVNNPSSTLISRS